MPLRLALPAFASRLQLCAPPSRFVLLVTAALLGSPAAAAQSGDLTELAKAALVEKAGALLKDLYVFPDVAEKCDARMRALTAKGIFKEVSGVAEFGAQMTEALQEISQDKHILVRVRPSGGKADRAEPSHPLRERARSRGRARRKNYGFARVERLEGNVGYLDLRYFASPTEGFETATAAMAFLDNTDALIFDMRQNGGGNPGMVHLLCSYLFTERIHLNSFYYREGDRTEDFYTLEGVPGRQRPDVPVFVLTSASTFSGAEEFSYNLRSLKRATLVGETTRGGANPGNLFPLGAQLEIFIPIGRAINPITGTNWEGTGVKPHVAVPSDEALGAALKLAGPAAEAHRSAMDQRWDAFETALREALVLDDKDRSEAAAARMASALAEAHSGGLLDETGVNMFGYDLLGKDRIDLAVATLSFNAATYPSSANCHDSLGEALRAAGAWAESLASYERALMLDPAGPSAPAARLTIAELKRQVATDDGGDDDATRDKR